MDPEKERMRLQLCKLVEDWNANRLDLFSLSQPNEDLEFHGVMRFFFQEAGQKVATKCIRVSSTATTRAVIDALIEKFHPDLRMLSTPKYSLWEVHENGEERQLRVDEKPLLVQLNWHKDDREGRFLLRRDNADNKGLPFKNIDVQLDEKQMKRKLSKREKKEQKKKEKRAIREAEDVGASPTNLYAEVPPTTFTRTISNPEIVMKKRRERKLAEKLKNIGDGGSLKIYGEEVSGGTKPYVTLLVSIRDRVDRILREALEKYGIDYQRCGDEYYLAEIRSPLVDDDDEGPDDDLEHRPGQPQTERALDDDDCPLLIYAHDANKANITFHVRRKTPAVAREVENRRKSKASLSDAMIMDQQQQQVRTPCLIELNNDGTESDRKHFIHPNVTEIGNDRALLPPYGIPIHGPYVHARHCVLAFMDGVVTLTPCSPNADLKIDERPISETTVLYRGQTIRIGRSHLYRFLDLATMNGSLRASPQEQQSAIILKRTPSEQGMIRSGSTHSSSHSTNTTHAGIPMSSTVSPRLVGARFQDGGGSEIGLIVEGQRFATTFDVDGDVKTFIVPFVTRTATPSPVGTGRSGGGTSIYEVSPNELQHRVDTPFVSLTPTPMVPVTHQKDLQHYNRAPAATPVPEFNQQQPQVPSAAVLAQQRRTPPIFPQPSQVGPPRPTTLFGRDAIPAIIELLDNSEDDFLSAILRDTQPERVNFKLAPAYVIYMCCRYRVSPHYRTGIRPEERNRKLAEFLTKVIGRMHVTIQDHCHEVTPLSFWMANCSELLNFVKLDAELNACTVPEPQESMADAVQKAYDHLAAYFKQELHATMHSILDLSLDDHASTSPCIHMLSGAMSVLRHCRVNAALTIQIFSQLFHYVNMYLFNWLVSREGGAYCMRQWGVALRRRLMDIQAWSEKQGLEAAAECRLERILQASQLLQMPKTPEGFAVLHSATTKLNSLQLRSILERYRPEIGEPAVERELIEALVKIAEDQVDDALRLDGQMVQLEEELDLQLPFLLPDDGYSPQVVRGIPNGLREFVESLLQMSICRMILQPSSSGSWTVHIGGVGTVTPAVAAQNTGYQSPTAAVGRTGSISSTSNLAPLHQNAPEIVHISFQKGDGGIGLSIIQAQGVGQTQAGIYVKNVVPGSSAARDGRLEAGDQLLKVNGQSLVGISQEAAAKLMGASGPAVHFEVAKGAVLYNGLATVIYQPSPDVSQRGLPPMRSPGGGSQSHMATSRVRSIEHLPQHVIQQQRNGGDPGIVRSTYSNAPPTLVQKQALPQQQPQHQRYPSSSSLQQPHYYQQHQQPQVNSLKTGPPPVQYHMMQQKPSSTQYNHGRSMSASNLKEDAPTPTEVRRHVIQQQPRFETQSQPPETPAPRATAAIFPPAGGQSYIPHRQQQYPASAEEQYYQNLAQYQTQPQQYPMATGSVARRMSASDYGSGAPLPHSSGGAISAYSNQEYHRLPTTPQPQIEQQAFNVHRAPQNNTNFGNGHAASLSTSSFSSSHCPAWAPRSPARSPIAYAQPPANASDQLCHQNNANACQNGRQPSSSTVNGSVQFRRQSQSQLTDYQNLPLNNTDESTLSQVPWRRPSTPTAYEDTTASSLPQHHQHVRQASYQHQPHYVNQTVGSKRNEVPPLPPQVRPHAFPQRVPTDSQEPLRYPTPTVEYASARSQGQDQHQPIHQRLGQQAAAVALASGQKWRNLEKEEQERLIEAEYERYLHEEIAKLEAKEFLSDDETKRYRALKLSLEYRRRLHSLDSEGGGLDEGRNGNLESTVKVESEFDDILRSLAPFSAKQREVPSTMENWQNSLDQGDEISMENSIKRQQMRDHYFEEAEQRYIEAAARERYLKENGRTEQETIGEMNPAQEQEDERKRDFARLHINELQAKLQNVGMADEEPKKTNGYESIAAQKLPPEVPPKRKVVFSDTPEYGPEQPPVVSAVAPQLSHAYRESVGSPVDRNYPSPPPEPPKKYVYDVNPDDQQPRAQVIGAQEVYRDPRQERLKNLQPRKQQTETEKLSFKDKMRLFAAEIGESTPKDRMKASSAQREIEGTMNGSGQAMTG